MTKKFVVAVKDSAIQAFGQPFFMPSIGAAVRSFSDEVNRPAEDNQFYRHPDDYEMSVLAMYDDETGAFETPADGVRVIARAKDLKTKDGVK